MRILLSACGPLPADEVVFLYRFMRALRESGVYVKIWLDHQENALSDFALPFDWSSNLRQQSLLRKVKAMRPRLKGTRLELTEEEKSKWDERIRREPAKWLALRCGATPAVHIPAAISQISSRVFDIVRPTHFFAWNPLYYYFGIPFDLYRKAGVEVGSLERGPLLGTLLFDRGILGESSLNDVSVKSLKGVSGNTTDSLFSRLGPLWNNESPITFPRGTDKPVVLVLPTSDFQSGLLPECGPDSHRVLPFHHSFADLVSHLCDLDLAEVWVKPHPHCSRSWMCELPDAAVVVDGDPAELISASSAIVANGTKLEFLALKAGKPVVLPGFGLLWNKGIAFEATTKEGLEEKLRAAISDGTTESMHFNFVRYVRWLMERKLADNRLANDPEYLPDYVQRFLKTISR